MSIDNRDKVIHDIKMRIHHFRMKNKWLYETESKNNDRDNEQISSEDREQRAKDRLASKLRNF